MRDLPRRVPQIEWWSDPGSRVRDKAYARAMECAEIARCLREMGYDATSTMVNGNYRRFIAWKEGRLSVGFLCKATGLRKRKGT